MANNKLSNEAQNDLLEINIITIIGRQDLINL